MYRPYNPNPLGRRTDDCVIRAIAKAFNISWEQSYDLIVDEGRKRYDVPEANHVWIGFLEQNGFHLFAIRNTCPNCYTVRDFCEDHPHGTYIIGDGKHVVTAVAGDWYDSWDSGDLVPAFYLRRQLNGIQ